MSKYLNKQKNQFSAPTSILKEFEAGSPSFISGVMPKFWVKIENNTLISTNEKDAEYLLKSSLNEDELLCENEDFFLWLAKQSKINTSSSSLITIDNNKYLLSEKFFKDDELLIHLSDILNKEERKNINLSTILNKLNQLPNPKDLKRDILRQLVFSNIIGNFDLHAKNIALIYSENEYRVAPAYDITSTYVYGDSTRAPIKVNNKPSDVELSDIIIDFKENSELGDEIFDIINETITRIKTNYTEIENSYMDENMKDFLSQYITIQLDKPNKAIETQVAEMKSNKQFNQDKTR